MTTPPNDVEITPEMIEAGLTWLYAYDRDYSLEHDKETVRGIITAALAAVRGEAREVEE